MPQNLDLLSPAELQTIQTPELIPYAQLKALILDLQSDGQDTRALLLEGRLSVLRRQIPLNLRW